MKLELQVEGVFDELQDVYKAEHQFIIAFPPIGQATYSAELKRTLKQYLLQSEAHARRLEQFFASFDCRPSYLFCKGIQTLNGEGEGMNEPELSDEIRDARLQRSNFETSY